MPRRRGRRRSGAALAALLIALLGACSNNESATNKRPHAGAGTASDDAGVQQITITTGNDYRFHPSTVTARPGGLHVVLRNTSPGGAPHDLSVDKVAGAFVPLAPAGTSTEATFTLTSPGTYRFVCTIHIAQGQTGTLIVRPGG